MGWKVILSERSINDLGSICKYIAQDNQDAAERLGLDLFEAAEGLADFPKTGKIYANTDAGDIYSIICRGYRIFFQINDAEKYLAILHIRHGAREEPGF